MTDKRIAKLPNWAQARIRSLESRVKALEMTLPWTKPGMAWFTLSIPGPDPCGRFNARPVNKLWVLHEEEAHWLCDIWPEDVVFVGRGTKP